MEKIELIVDSIDILENEYYRITHSNGITDNYQLRELDTSIDSFRYMCEEIHNIYSSEPEYYNIDLFYKREFGFSLSDIENILEKINKIIKDLEKAKKQKIYYPKNEPENTLSTDEGIIDIKDIPF